ncbi:hypothetical protein M433DRAFT_374588 [Acidomyces richmondensis BFW]|nr:hypothetical protein M433DRAFT_374588 [Acidomyces richmondensis BFW]
MVDALLDWLRQSLPDELAALANPYLTELENGDFEALLKSAEAKQLFGHDITPQTENIHLEDFSVWSDFIFQQLGSLMADRSNSEKQVVFFCIGYAALLAFLQLNVTGPPLPFSSSKILFPRYISEDERKVEALRGHLLETLRMDGIAAYKLTPDVELLCLADAVMTSPPILKNFKAARWAKVRINFIQQRLFSEVSSTLQNAIYDDLDILSRDILGPGQDFHIGQSAEVEFLLERATIHTHHGLDRLARADLDEAKAKRSFLFSLTGLRGKRTKFQDRDVSQLVVLARSSDCHRHANGLASIADRGERKVDTRKVATGPVALDLDDDTLLESISFSERPADRAGPVTEESLPYELTSLDPSHQPQLDPLDSIILLNYASSITNTSPQHGLTREETLPYATRVLEGGSSNWQVYTQALLLRSRIEGYKTRTVERGLLQLQTLVDQVIADTTGPENQLNDTTTATPPSFLPRPKSSESAKPTERLRYVFQLATPTRWDLEAELASRWVQLGGLRSALDIYERLQMWAEVALCWAATDREDKAKRIVRRQLYHATSGPEDDPQTYIADDESWEGPERRPPPLDAPRLYCILGDIDQSVEMYEKAWEVSSGRYARAQRSLGRLYFAARDFIKAAEAYSKSLKINQLNANSWFAFGCALLELKEYEKSAEAFSRCVQLDDTDAEAWSNFAAALLHVPPAPDTIHGENTPDDGQEIAVSRGQTEYRPRTNRRDALMALKRAAALKHDSYRIWENILTVSASLSPPDYVSALSAQKRIIDLRGDIDGERCIDEKILEMIVQHVVCSSTRYDPSQPGLNRTLVQLMDRNIVPLITGSADLWLLVSKLARWREKPNLALDAEEKAWRTVISQTGWETDNEEHWNEVVEATVRLCDAYEILGPKERTEGMGAGELVAKDWKFKARSALRAVINRGRAAWEDTKGYERLQIVLQGLKL